MRGALLIISISVIPFVFGCNSVDSGYGYSRPYVPVVSMPPNLDETERDLLPDIEDVFEDAGYRPTFSGGAEYELDFEVESGPINTDVRMRLFRGRQEIAGAYARSGGARSIFRRGQVVRDAFEKCLHEFDARLPRPAHSGPGYDTRRDDRYRREGADDDRDYRDGDRRYEYDRYDRSGYNEPD
jgi:hypothetical protein